MDPSLSVWVIDYDPSAAPGLPAVLGERSRVDPAGTIYFKVGPLDTDWSLTPGGGVGIVTSVTGTAPISSTGGTTPDISLNDTSVTPGSYTYSSITVDQKGRLTAASSGAAPGPANAQYWVSTPDATLTAEVNMGALGSGTLQQTTTLGVATPTVFAGTTGSIPFYTANGQLAQDNAALFWNAAGDYMVFGGPADQVIQKEGGGGLYFGTATANPLGFYTNNFTWATISSAGVLTYAGTTGLVYTPSTNSFVMGTATPAAGVAMQVTKNQNAGTSLTFTNNSVGGSAYTNFILAQSDNFASGSSFGMALFSTGSTFSSPYGVDVAILSKDSGTGNLHFWIDQNAGDFVWFTKATYPNPPERMRLETGGNLSVANLSAGGVVYATATTAVLKIGTAAEVAGAITWPAQGLVLISDGVNDAPVGVAGFNYEGANDNVELSDGVSLTHYNLGSASAGNYERVRAFWSSNVWTLQSEEGGTGTVRVMYVNADTAMLALNGSTVAITATTASTVATTITLSGVATMLVSSTFAMNNVDGANAERVRAFWSGNVWNLKSEEIGSGTIRSMAIDADTAALTLAGDAGWSLTSTSVAVASETGGTGHNLSITGNNSDGQLIGTDWAEIVFLTTAGDANSSISLDFGAPGITLSASPTIASDAAAVLDAIHLSSSVSISGTTTISTAAGFNAVSVRQPTYAKSGGGAVTVTNAATFYIENSPQQAAGVTITNEWALWVDAGISRFDGNGTHVFELPADATANAASYIGRFPVLVAGTTRYIRYHSD